VLTFHSADDDWDIDQVAMSSDWNFEDMNVNISSNRAKFKELSIMEAYYFFYIHWLIPKAMGLKLTFFLKDFKQSDSQNVFQLE
jgi:hypothetical protein